MLTGVKTAFCSMWFGAERPKWLGPVPYTYPPYLEGEAPGDFGYDILGLAKERSNFDKYFK